MSIQTVLELELSGRGQGWTDTTSDLGDQTIEISRGIKGNGIADRVASTGSAKFELVNENPQGRYSLNHVNVIAGFALGIGVRIRLELDAPQGTGSGYQVDSVGGHPSGTTTVDTDTGTGTLLKNDIITFAGVSGRYIVISQTGAIDVTFSPGLAGAVADDAAIALVGRNFTQFRGRLDGADPVPGIFERRTVRLEAVDWMDDAARVKVKTIPVQINRRADQIFQTLVDAVPFQPVAIEADLSPDTYPVALDTAKDEQSSVMSELQKVALSELGFIYVKGDGTVVFESRNRRAVVESVVDTFIDVEALSGFEAGVNRDDSLSRVQMITHPRRVDDAATTVLFRLENPLQVGGFSTATILGPYRDPLQEAARVGGTDMVTPVATTDYVANSRADGTGSDVTGSISLVVNFGGNGASVVVTNAGSSAAFVTLLQLRGRGIYDYQNVILEAEDAAAQIDIGTTATGDMPFQQDAAIGLEVAQWLLSLYRDAENLANEASVFIPNTDEVLATRVLAREISDKILIIEQMTGFVDDPVGGHFIQSVDTSIDERNHVEVKWGLAPANRELFWLLEMPGRSELDNSTFLGYGLVVGHTDQSHSDTHDDGAHVDVAHVDIHGDISHLDDVHDDTTHTDTHTDTAHDDSAHADSHSDTTHVDVSHSDLHSDVDAVSEHGDVAHVDSHGDVPHDDHDDEV